MTFVTSTEINMCKCYFGKKKFKETGFTPHKAEQPLKGMELQKNK